MKNEEQLEQIKKNKKIEKKMDKALGKIGWELKKLQGILFIFKKIKAFKGLKNNFGLILKILIILYILISSYYLLIKK